MEIIRNPRNTRSQFFFDIAGVQEMYTDILARDHKAAGEFLSRMPTWVRVAVKGVLDENTSIFKTMCHVEHAWQDEVARRNEVAPNWEKSENTISQKGWI